LFIEGLARGVLAVPVHVSSTKGAGTILFRAGAYKKLKNILPVDFELESVTS
jgi:hypothetical protein